ncbi:nucleotidyltransferase domain-containing protein [Geobacter argillaceus]|uniref:nucleotidyltransferase domain-containing protein n=1 Tax=Geobacter argillaceus TaxID=345631 RepID=UPI00119E9942|nr:nucleotidyltransferase domain-containing protein [Geobacter argillaceus]
MRLTDQEQQSIIDSIVQFDRNAEIYLFGSRLDDSARGGDIDILIKSDVIHRDMTFLLEEELFKHIEEQKVDFVITGSDVKAPFVKMILARGAIRLWH